MSDLIDKDKVINAIVRNCRLKTENSEEYGFIEILEDIADFQTAYDVEMVIDQLKENEQEITSQLEKSAKNAPNAVQETNLKLTAQLFRDYTKSQIEIVKSGGVAND